MKKNSSNEKKIVQMKIKIVQKKYRTNDKKKS